MAPGTPQRGTGGGSKTAPARPILGPITRRGSEESKQEDGQGQGDGQQEFAPQFLDFQSRVGFMKKVGCFKTNQKLVKKSLWYVCNTTFS